MKILIVGGSGMLGSDLVLEALRRGFDVEAPSPAELDLGDPESVARLNVDPKGARWCINCAAYTAVDKAETEREEAAVANTLGPGYLAASCAMAGIKLLHVSTDFVFDGTAKEPYTEDMPTNPMGHYGLTKRDGEDAVLSALPSALVVRTAWLYGPNGNSFPRTMIRAWEAGKSLRVVADQVGCPTYTADLARTLIDMIEKDVFPGVYHAAGPEAMSWHDFAMRTLEAWNDRKPSGRNVEIEPIPSDAYPTPAKRPIYSVLSTQKLQAAGVAPMGSVSDSLADFIGRGLGNDGWL